MSSGGQTPVTQQTQQTRDPWAPAQNNLQQSLNLSRYYSDNDVGYQPYTGQTQAGLDPNFTTGAQGLAYMMTPEAYTGSAGVNAARQLGLQQIQDAGGTNPYLEGLLNTSNRRISDKINSSMSGAGRYGSGAHTDVAARAMAEAANPILAEDYSQGLQRAGQWAQLMPTLDAARMAPAQSLMGLGQYYNERSQKALDDQIKLFNAQQARPWEQVARLNAIAGGAGGLGGTQFGTQTTPINQPSTMQKLFGGAAAGAGIGGSFGGPVGAGIGAVGGGLLGLL
jgi:hypothetical protein